MNNQNKGVYNSKFELKVGFLNPIVVSPKPTVQWDYIVWCGCKAAAGSGVTRHRVGELGGVFYDLEPSY